MEIPEIVQKLLGKQVLAPQVSNILPVKMEVLHIVDNLAETGTDGESALVRHIPEEHVKICDLVLAACLKISVAHGQLVKVAEHGHVQFLFRIHTTPQCNVV